MLSANLNWFVDKAQLIYLKNKNIKYNCKYNEWKKKNFQTWIQHEIPHNLIPIFEGISSTGKKSYREVNRE